MEGGCGMEKRGEGGEMREGRERSERRKDKKGKGEQERGVGRGEKRSRKP